MPTSLSITPRAPYAFEAVGNFFVKRALPHVELCAADEEGFSYTRTFALDHKRARISGWLRVAHTRGAQTLILTPSDSLKPAMPDLRAHVERTFDINADSALIDRQLGPLLFAPGLRVAGALDPFELAVRAVLGQQVTVAAATHIAGRLVERFGEPIATPYPALTRLFPTPRALAARSVTELAECRIIRTRAQTIITMAEQCVAGTIDLSGKADAEATIAQLRAIKGIGPWTAQYIAMRALRMPDAFPVGDVALRKAAGVTADAQLLAYVEHARPWRAYAVINLWHSLSI
jgi:AraC family transcriptional regulator, regulatory protein of adaptative response / DNA-3-methyladenine glycosylase II